MQPILVKVEKKQTPFDIYIGPAFAKGKWKLTPTIWNKSLTETNQEYEQRIAMNLGELSGKKLGCLCDPDQDCHGKILIRLCQEKGFLPHQEPQKPKKKRKATEVHDPPAKKSKKLFRNQTSHPQGIRDKKVQYPWPITNHEWNTYSIYIDEAGMGSLAGPLYVGGAVLLPGFDIQGLHDSKLLRVHEREAAYEQLTHCPHLLYHVEKVSNTEIDDLKLGGAWREGIRRTIHQLREKATVLGIDLKQVILDGNRVVKETELPVVAEISADRRFAGVSAAAILAKVSRDQYMASIASEYPEFTKIFIERHGYYSNEHKELILQGKYTPLHRKSFNPLAEYLQSQSTPPIIPRTRHNDSILPITGANELSRSN